MIKRLIINAGLALLAIPMLTRAMTITGTVTDAVTGKALSGVLVQADKYEGRYPGFTTSVTTDASGQYALNYTPGSTGIASLTRDAYRPENLRYTLYAVNGKVIHGDLSGPALTACGRDLADGMYLVGYDIDNEVTLRPFAVLQGRTSSAGLRTRSAAKLAAAQSLQTDTLVSFSKDGYTTRAFIKDRITYTIKLYPRTAIGSKPGPGNTGPTGPLRLGGGGALKSGGTAGGWYFTGTLNISATDVTLKNFVIDAGGLMYGVQSYAAGLVLEDGEIINSLSAGVMGSNYTIRRLNLHEHDVDATKPFDNAVMEGCWVHHIGRHIEAHADGLQMVGGKNVTVKGNNFDLGLRNSNYHCSQVIIVQTNNGPVENIFIDDNWINGGGYMIQSRDKGTGFGPPKNVRVRNNIFGTDYLFGAKMGYFAEWSGNTWYDGKACVTGKYPN